MGINRVEKTDDFVKIKHVLISVSDKSGLDDFIPGLVSINPEIKIFSTGVMSYNALPSENDTMGILCSLTY